MRRLVGIVVAAVGGLLLAPVMLLVAALIWWRLGSPVFRQQRSGLRGREFTILKFRTMRPPLHAAETDDARDTPLGPSAPGGKLGRVAAAGERVTR